MFGPWFLPIHINLVCSCDWYIVNALTLHHASCMLQTCRLVGLRHPQDYTFSFDLYSKGGEKKKGYNYKCIVCVIYLDTNKERCNPSKTEFNSKFEQAQANNFN